MPAPICKDCHFVEVHPTEDSIKYTCSHPELAYTDLVSGKVDPGDCYMLRRSLGNCGPSGRYFRANTLL